MLDVAESTEEESGRGETAEEACRQQEHCGVRRGGGKAAEKQSLLVTGRPREQRLHMSTHYASFSVLPSGLPEERKNN
jgi:hypothetical protein